MTLEVPMGAEPSDVSSLASQLREPDGESEALLTRLIESPESLRMLGDDHADSIMLKTLAWLHALDDESFEFEAIVCAFYRKHVDVLRGSPVIEGEEEIILEGIQRTLVGVAQGIETTLPRQLRRSGGAVFRITWTDEGGVGAWDSDESDTPISIPMSPLVLQAAEVLGDFKQPRRDLLATAILKDLRAGVLSLPGFGLGPTPEEEMLSGALGKEGEANKETALRWKPPETEIESKHLEDARADMSPESIRWLDEELRRWASDPTAAAREDSQTIHAFLSHLPESNVTEGVVVELDGILHCLARSDSNAVKSRLQELRARLTAKPSVEVSLPSPIIAGVGPEKTRVAPRKRAKMGRHRRT